MSDCHGRSDDEGVREGSVRLERVLEYRRRFSMGEADSQKAALRLSACLRALGIPHAIAGGLAVAVHGHDRVTVDVDVILTPAGLARFKEESLGHGWVERFAGSKGVRDTVHDVPIAVLVSGDYPGDGKPKPVAFPDPGGLEGAGEGVPVVPLDTLLELKLASGMTAPHRLQDLADVIELIRRNDLPREHAMRLDPYVREKFDELWTYAQQADNKH